MQLKTTLLGAAVMLGAALPMAAHAAPTTGTMTPTAMTALSAQDQVFLVRAAEGNMAEVTLAQLALDKSKTPGVQSVARTIIDGHGRAQTELLGIARGKGMTAPPMLSPTHMAVQKSLGKARRANFDKMYMANQTDDHENTIALFQTEVANGQDADLKAYAAKYLPDIVGHTIMIYQVAAQVGAPGSEMRPPSPPVPPGVTPTMMPMPGMAMGGGMTSGGTTSGTAQTGNSSRPYPPTNSGGMTAPMTQ